MRILQQPASTVALGAAFLVALHPLAAQQRPFTFLDVQQLRSAGSWAPSADRQMLLYTVSTPDWEDAETYADIHVVSLVDGVASSRQLTFTEDENEGQPAWSPDGSYFVFASDRDQEGEGDGDQLYIMRHDGGEARKLTDADDGVSDFRFSPDSRWLVYRSGESGREQLYRLATDDLLEAEPVRLTKAEAGVQSWDWSPSGASVYFVRRDTLDADEELRRERGFTVDVSNAVTPLSSLWAVDVSSAAERVLVRDAGYGVVAFEVSEDGRWIAYLGGSAERYERGITEAGLYADAYLLELASGHIERLTENVEVSESLPSFSPDGRWIAFSAPDDMERYSMTERRVYLREVGARGGAFRKLGSSFDNSLSVDFWSEDSRKIYFSAGVRATSQFHELDLESGRVRQLTDERASLSVDRDEDTGVLLIEYTDPRTPPTLFTVARADDVAVRSSWTQLIDINRQVAEVALGDEAEVTWRSSDGKTVGGVLVYPVGYQRGTRYPLIVAIHGGPAAAEVLRFNGGYNAQVYAGQGYAVLRPNYRGSTNYGNAHRTDIVGDYFTLGYDDIMTGVDHLISEGIVDGERMGALGWSAGGHWSNWILTHTDRFKAISSGAGVMNWISMYAQSDMQRNRQFYVGDGFLYEDFDTYFDQSPLKYITNASTPTMIHVVEGDPRVPAAQSLELHMALKRLGVPTELFMYPGRTHGIPDPRNRLVKAVAEMAWMDHYVRGIGERFHWRQVLETLPSEERPRAISEQ